MGMMQAMDAKDIRWSVLESEFDPEKFRLVVVEGKDPDGTQLKADMPRWQHRRSSATLWHHTRSSPAILFETVLKEIP